VVMVSFLLLAVPVMRERYRCHRHRDTYTQTEREEKDIPG
jgi:hypothetical protein